MLPIKLEKFHFLSKKVKNREKQAKNRSKKAKKCKKRPEFGLFRISLSLDSRFHGNDR